jgi:hypothetical protein
MAGTNAQEPMHTDGWADAHTNTHYLSLARTHTGKLICSCDFMTSLLRLPQAAILSYVLSYMCEYKGEADRRRNKYIHIPFPLLAEFEFEIYNNANEFQVIVEANKPTFTPDLKAFPMIVLNKISIQS